jgi:hypothetical protein
VRTNSLSQAEKERGQDDDEDEKKGDRGDPGEEELREDDADPDVRRTRREVEHELPTAGGEGLSYAAGRAVLPHGREYGG